MIQQELERTGRCRALDEKKKKSIPEGLSMKSS
jgi:hypothetical protein